MTYEEKVIEDTIEKIKKLRGQHKGLGEALLWLYFEAFKQGVYTSKKQ